MKNGLFPALILHGFCCKRPFLQRKWCFSSDFAPPCTCVTKVWKESLLFCDTEFAQEYEFEFQNHVFFFRFFTASPLEAKNFFRRTVIEVTLITFVKASLMKLSLMRFYCCNYFISDCFLLFQIHPKFPALNALCFLALEIVTFWLALSKRSHVPTWVTIIHTPIICSLWQIDNHISEIRVARARAENIDYLQ